MSVATNFDTFCKSLLIVPSTRSTISTRYLAICKRLNIDFWGYNVTTGGRYVGSFGRNTATNYISDIDMVFELSYSTYSQYNDYQGNGQSALLQAVKNSIAKTYPITYIKSDGQIVAVSFTTGSDFEVLPVFKNGDESYTFADSNDGGSWKKTNPLPEIEMVGVGDRLTNNNLRYLCRMARSWKYYCNVPIKGILIDTLAFRFLTDWEYKDKSYLYYDWMSRDFFYYLKNQPKDQTTWYAIGSQQAIYNPINFRYKALLAYNKSVDAIQYYLDELYWLSNKEWRDIYGYRFPKKNI